MIRCPWCGAKNYAIDMWCTRCSHHLDWAPARGRPHPLLSFLATTAAVVAVSIALAVPVAGWFEGTRSIELTLLPSTGVTHQASNAAAANAPVMSKPAQPTPTAETTPSPTPDSTLPSGLPAAPEPAVQGPAPAALANTTGDPADAVRRFYSAVSAHQFDVAASLWSAAMQAQYPPTVFIDQRFSATQQINVAASRVVADAGDTAVVYVDVVELIGDATRRWVGTWQLVNTSSGWLLNSPNLQAQD